MVHCFLLVQRLCHYYNLHIPLTQCHTTLSNQKAAIADQTCDSNPHKVIIVDVSGNNHSAFFVGNHSKNGSGKYTEATILNKNDLIAISKQKNDKCQTENNENITCNNEQPIE